MLQGVRNFRDIGGHVTESGQRVRAGRVYRAGHLAAATDDDLSTLERRTIIETDGAAIIHCSAAKDRTGWGSSLMLLALGVPESTVIEHYLESNKQICRFRESILEPER